jgi:ubiquinone/menaquinone biosynthesis C-methylase UbiE
MSHEKGYVLGTGEDEIERLGLQHRLWSREAHEAWERARFRRGQTILDLGSGPGHATFELAARVASEGTIIAVDLSTRFLDHLRRVAKERGLSNITILERDARDLGLEPSSVDGAWGRWILSFVPEPERALEALARALRPGGAVAFQEYAAYSAMRLEPPSEALERVAAAIDKCWRVENGDPNVALKIPSILRRAGLDVREIRPLARATRSDEPLWKWPESFFRNYLPVLEKQGWISSDLRRAFEEDWRDRSSDPHAHFVCPILWEIIAVKRP